MANINNLPQEVLLKIFAVYRETHTQRNFINNVANVCHYWKELCMDASLWNIFDGTLPFKILKEFCWRGYLKHTEILIISKMENSSDSKDLKLIYQNMPAVKKVNFTNVLKKIDQLECLCFFSDLVEYCPKLQEIILNEANPSLKSFASVTSYYAFERFIYMRGSKLISLDFSNVSFEGILNLFSIIGSTCPNLERLKACNLHSSLHIFPIEDIQNGLRKLKVLHLGFNVILAFISTSLSPGFPELVTFSYPCIGNTQCISDLSFKKLLMKSPYLKELDIRGCSNVSAHSLCSLPAANLEKLYVSYTKLCLSKDFDNVLQKWSHSLIELDISKQESAINDCLLSFVSSGSFQTLVSLNVNNTLVKMSTVKVIIENCPKLNYLQLESGKDFARRTHRGKIAIQELLSRLNDDVEIT
ncbi:f-box domain-containing protein [Nephila pilipes]|uniref:F-box domain-containing protein n=1 Tax=Nephila pilipes TaxID=299642 RepID=A0A8X6SZY4_NEPPI|nr:f-box domain-containing protein [Nephila pilipes]